jgi:hypothetical protein
MPHNVRFTKRERGDNLIAAHARRGRAKQLDGANRLRK